MYALAMAGNAIQRLYKEYHGGHTGGGLYRDPHEIATRFQYLGISWDNI